MTPDVTAPTPLDTATPLERELAGYSPGWFARTFGLAKGHKAKLAAAITIARHDDHLANEAAAAQHQRDLGEAAAARALAAGVISGDPGALQGALEEVDPFEELREVGVNLDVSFPGNGVAVVALTAHERTVIPEHQESLTTRGKLSSKKMPKGLGNEIYQDYLCGAALRACRELFAALPLEWIVATVHTDMLDLRTGHVGAAPVLSLVAPRRTVEGLRYEGLDPSEAMANFTCRMTFKKGTGMARIEPLTVQDVEQFDQARGSSGRGTR